MKFVVYDIECLMNVFTLCAWDLPAKKIITFEISPFRNDYDQLKKWMEYLQLNSYKMVGYNNFHYDLPVLQELFKKNNSLLSSEELNAIAYKKSKQIIFSKDKFHTTIWDDSQMVHQVDPFKIHHFDNNAKRVSLKRLEFNMRRRDIVEFELPFDEPIKSEEDVKKLRVYNKEDVFASKEFLEHSMEAIEFREALIKKFGTKVLNFSDSRLGEQTVVDGIIDQVGKDKVYYWEEDFITGKHVRHMYQTPRTYVPLYQAILPTVKFEHEEFKDVFRELRDLKCHIINNKFYWTTRPDYMHGRERIAKGKGIFKTLKDTGADKEDIKKVLDKLKTLEETYRDVNGVCTVGDFVFDIGKGGLHGARNWSSYHSTPKRMIRDVDVTSFYPSIAIEYGIKPEHMPSEFSGVYKRLKELRLTHKKGTPMNLALKLALNTVYGKSNSRYSPFYDPLYTIKITLNGQLFLMMLWDQLMDVPTIEIIQANTDGITYAIDRKYLGDATKIEDAWQKQTRMELEDVEYESIFLRDVNNYVCKSVEGKVKAKGCFSYMDLNHGQEDLSGVAWHKNHGAIIVKKAAVAHLIEGVSVTEYITTHRSVWDFFLCTNVNRSSRLLWGEDELQRNTRYLISKEGKPLTKIMPPIPFSGKTEEREIGINVGFNADVVNTVDETDAFEYPILYDWYIDETNKLLQGF